MKAAALVLTHGHEDHIGAVPHVLPLRRRPGLRHAADAGAGRAQARGARHRRRRSRLVPIAPRGKRAGRPAHDRVPARHAQHPRLRGAGDPHARSARSSTPATSRSTRRRSTASTSTCTGSPSSGARGVLALFADSTNIDRPGFTGSELDVMERVRGDLHRAPRGKLVVATFASSIYRMQILVDLAEQFGRKVAFVGRGMVENVADRAAARLPARSRPGCLIRDTDVRNHPARQVLCIDDRVAGRAAWRRCPRIAIDDHRHVALGPDDRGGLLGARDPRQREGDRPGDEPPGAARRRRRHRRRASTCTCRATAARRS